MQPSVSSGDFVVATRPRRIRRGDVVVLRRRDGLEVCKRVVGLPGEHVAVREGRVLVGGEPLHEPYAKPGGASGEWSLGPVEYVALGDDRSSSTDSRTFGPVDRSAILGVVRARYWPRPGLV